MLHVLNYLWKLKKKNHIDIESRIETTGSKEEQERESSETEANRYKNMGVVVRHSGIVWHSRANTVYND
jgi:hypothetical protein